MESRDFIMFTNQFGSDIFIADKSKTNGNPITDKIDEAEVWQELYDMTKFKYWKAVTGYNLEIRYV
jgi:hypothetical protein